MPDVGSVALYFAANLVERDTMAGRSRIVTLGWSLSMAKSVSDSVWPRLPNRSAATRRSLWRFPDMFGTTQRWVPFVTSRFEATGVQLFPPSLEWKIETPRGSGLDSTTFHV